MAFGFPAYHTERYPPAASPDAALDAVRDALNALGWSIHDERSDRIVASTCMNLRSWGEKILISLREDNSISVTSKCALPTQCLDWGKNKDNVTQFMMKMGGQV